MHIPDGAFLEQDDIAVPAMGLHTGQHRHWDEAAFPLQPGEIKQAGAFAETAIRLLKRYDVSADFLNDAAGSIGIELAVTTNAFMHIVGGDDREGMVFRRRRRTLPLTAVAQRLHDESGQAGVFRQSRFFILQQTVLFHAFMPPVSRCACRTHRTLKIRRSEPQDTLHKTDNEWPRIQFAEPHGQGGRTCIPDALPDRCCEFLIHNFEIDLKVQPQRTRIEIGRTDVAPAPVDHQKLGMVESPVARQMRQ